MLSDAEVNLIGHQILEVAKRLYVKRAGKRTMDNSQDRALFDRCVSEAEARFSE